MTTFNFSAPANGGNPAFNFSVTGTQQTVTQDNGSGGTQNITGYVLSSATGTINGESISLYTSGYLYQYDQYSSTTAMPIVYNNVLKESATGDSGTATFDGVDGWGLLFQSSTSLYQMWYDGTDTIIYQGDLNGIMSVAYTYPTPSVTSNAPCYVTGTRLRTDRGETAIEDLAVGDRLVTLSGEAREVIWVGRKTVDCAAHPRPHDVLPICIAKGALAPGLPARDLFVSPWRALHFDGALISAQSLVNGATITRETVAAVTYWHVELASHDVVYAEGVEAETYYAAANRHLFEGETARDEPETAPCLPVLHAGERVEAVRRYLWERARAMGGRLVEDAEVQIVADGEPLTPLSAADGCFQFQIPPGMKRLRLRSNSAIPDGVLAGVADLRRLGVNLVALTVDGASAPWDHESFSDGWHKLEGEAGSHSRWSTGDAALPLGRELALHVVPMPTYGLRLPPRPAPVVPAALRTGEGNVLRLMRSAA